MTEGPVVEAPPVLKQQILPPEGKAVVGKAAVDSAQVASALVQGKPEEAQVIADRSLREVTEALRTTPSTESQHKAPEANLVAEGSVETAADVFGTVLKMAEVAPIGQLALRVLAAGGEPQVFIPQEAQSLREQASQIAESDPDRSKLLQAQSYDIEIYGLQSQVAQNRERFETAQSRQQQIKLNSEYEILKIKLQESQKNKVDAGVGEIRPFSDLAQALGIPSERAQNEPLLALEDLLNKARQDEGMKKIVVGRFKEVFTEKNDAGKTLGEDLDEQLSQEQVKALEVAEARKRKERLKSLGNKGLMALILSIGLAWVASKSNSGGGGGGMHG